MTRSADSNTAGFRLPRSLSQGGILLATFPQWPRLVVLLYEHGIRLSQAIQPETAVVLALRASAPMAVAASPKENPLHTFAPVAANQ